VSQFEYSTNDKANDRGPLSTSRTRGSLPFGQGNLPDLMNQTLILMWISSRHLPYLAATSIASMVLKDLLLAAGIMKGLKVMRVDDT
jgi:hypothetical protein